MSDIGTILKSDWRPSDAQTKHGYKAFAARVMTEGIRFEAAGDMVQAKLRFARCRAYCVSRGIAFPPFASESTALIKEVASEPAQEWKQGEKLGRMPVHALRDQKGKPRRKAWSGDRASAKLRGAMGYLQRLLNAGHTEEAAAFAHKHGLTYTRTTEAVLKTADGQRIKLWDDNVTLPTNQMPSVLARIATEEAIVEDMAQTLSDGVTAQLGVDAGEHATPSAPSESLVGGLHGAAGNPPTAQDVSVNETTCVGVAHETQPPTSFVGTDAHGTQRDAAAGLYPLIETGSVPATPFVPVAKEVDFSWLGEDGPPPEGFKGFAARPKGMTVPTTSEPVKSQGTAVPVAPARQPTDGEKQELLDASPGNIALRVAAVMPPNAEVSLPDGGVVISGNKTVPARILVEPTMWQKPRLIRPARITHFCRNPKLVGIHLPDTNENASLFRVGRRNYQLDQEIEVVLADGVPMTNGIYEEVPNAR